MRLATADVLLRGLLDLTSTSPSAMGRDRAFLVLDTSGQIVECSTEASNLLGGREAAIGESFSRIWHDGAPLDDEVAGKGEPRSTLGHLVRHDGSEVPAAVTVRPLVDDQGKKEGDIVEIAVDGSTRLEPTTAPPIDRPWFLEAAFEATADGIVVADRQGTILCRNRNFAKMWRLSDADAFETIHQLFGVLLVRVSEREEFTRKIRWLEDHPEIGSFDVISLEDGRTFDGFSQPYRINDAVVGRVWSYRDVTTWSKAIAQLQTLQSVTELALQTRGLDTLLDALATRILEVSRGDSVSILLIDPMTSALVRRVRRSAEGAKLPRDSALMMAASRAASERKPVRGDEVMAGMRGHPRKILSLPIGTERGVSGVLQLVLAEKAHFKGDDARLIELITDRISTAIEHARLYEAEREADRVARAAAARLRVVADVSHALSEVRLDVARLLDVLAVSVARSMDAGCIAALISEDGGLLTSAHVSDPDDSRARIVGGVIGAGPLTTGHGFVARALRLGRPVILPGRNEVRSRLWEPYLELARRVDVGSVVLAPMRVSSRTIGVLALYHARERQRAEAAEDAQLLQELAQRAGLAIDNSRLFEQSVESLRLRDEFLNLASHELRTPLTALRLNLEAFMRAARSGDLEREVVDRWLSGLDRASRRYMTLVNQMLDVSRVHFEDHQLTVTSHVDLAAIVQNVVNEHALDARRASCEVTVHAAAPVCGSWDVERLEQVIGSLLSNAIKFGPGQPIEVDVFERAGLAELRVRDHGPGVRRDDQVRIFDRFVRAVSADHYGGLGLGLYLSREIVMAHGGSIHVASAPGEGAMFIVRLPLAPANAAAVQESESEDRGGSLVGPRPWTGRRERP